MAMLDEGTARRTSLQISDQLAQLGANLGTGSKLDVSSVSLEALNENLDASLDIYGDVILHPAFPRTDFERLKKQTAGADPAGKGRPGRAGAAGLSRTVVWGGPCLCQPMDRIGHGGVHGQDQARGSGPLSSDLVQTQPCHAGGRGRHHDGRDQAQARAALRILEAG